MKVNSFIIVLLNNVKSFVDSISCWLIQCGIQVLVLLLGRRNYVLSTKVCSLLEFIIVVFVATSGHIPSDLVALKSILRCEIILKSQVILTVNVHDGLLLRLLRHSCLVFRPMNGVCFMLLVVPVWNVLAFVTRINIRFVLWRVIVLPLNRFDVVTKLNRWWIDFIKAPLRDSVLIFLQQLRVWLRQHLVLVRAILVYVRFGEWYLWFLLSRYYLLGAWLVRLALRPWICRSRSRKGFFVLGHCLRKWIWLIHAGAHRLLFLYLFDVFLYPEAKELPDGDVEVVSISPDYVLLQDLFIDLLELWLWALLQLLFLLYLISEFAIDGLGCRKRSLTVWI